MARANLRRTYVRIQHFAAQIVVCVLAVLCWLLPASLATAEPPAASPPTSPTAEPAPITLPDTVAGRVMRRVLNSLADPSSSLGEQAFSDAFVKQVPYSQIEKVIADLNAAHGAFTPVKIDQQDGDRGLVVSVRTEKTKQVWQIHLGLNEQEKIEGLLMRPAMADEDTPPLRDWNDFDQRMRDLGGDVSFAAYELRLLKREGAADAASNVTPKLASVHVLNGDRQLAIGSTFKLYVLGALAEAVKDGKARWNESLAIKDIYKSLPSGKMQNEAVGAEFPISRYAEQMISISDNTATDHLMHRVGRQAIEDYVAKVHSRAKLNRPFLSTREIFAIKLKNDPTLIERWLDATEEVRRDMLLPDDPMRPTRPAGPRHNPGEIAAWNLDLSRAAEWTSPRNIDKIEWFASAEDLCKMMAELAKLEQLEGMEPLGRALRLNPGLPFNKQKWPKIAFKGGSEPGVLNLTWLLTRDDDKQYVVTIGWNNTQKALDESKLLGLAKRAVERLEK